MVTVANLVVTGSVWEKKTDPLAEALESQARRYWVNVFNSPMQIMRFATETHQRAMVRELDDWDDVNDPRPCYLLCTSPAAAEGLAGLSPLKQSLAVRERRLRFAAVGDETAAQFAATVKLEGIARVRREEVITPAVSGHADKLVQKLIETAPDGSIVFTLESASDSGDIARGLVSGGLRVVRLPVFSISLQNLIDLPKSDLPWWFLITNSSVLKTLVQDLRLQKKRPENVLWMGHFRSTETILRRLIPNAHWVELPDLLPVNILETISKSEFC